MECQLKMLFNLVARMNNKNKEGHNNKCKHDGTQSIFTECRICLNRNVNNSILKTKESHHYFTSV